MALVGWGLWPGALGALVALGSGALFMRWDDTAVEANVFDLADAFYLLLGSVVALTIAAVGNPAGAVAVVWTFALRSAHKVRVNRTLRHDGWRI